VFLADEHTLLTYHCPLAAIMWNDFMEELEDLEILNALN
jgi:hypothetical protein